MLSKIENDYCHWMSTMITFAAIKWSAKLTGQLLTVCKSLRNNISVTKPAPIPIGAKLSHAKSWPKRSPEKYFLKKWLLFFV